MTASSYAETQRYGDALLRQAVVVFDGLVSSLTHAGQAESSATRDKDDKRNQNDRFDHVTPRYSGVRNALQSDGVSQCRGVSRGNSVDGDGL